MDFKKLCCELINKTIIEFKEENHMEKIKDNVLDPCINYMVDQFYPYIIATCIIFILTFILAVGIFMILIFHQYKT